MQLELAADITGANFLALQKVDGGIRPIAVGDTLRRLVLKCLCAEVRDDARDLFTPLQVGVAVPFATEAVVRTVE